MTGKIDMSAIQDPELRRQLETALATIGDPQPGGTAAPAAPPANQPPPPPPATTTAPGSSTHTAPASTGAPPPPPPVVSPQPGTLGAPVANAEYTLRGSYQMKCYSMSTLPMSGSFDLTVSGPTVTGLLHHEGQTHQAEGTVTADGQISVTAMDAMVMTGRVGPSGTENSLSGSGEIKSESTMFGEAYSCSGTWSAQ
jgi:hypothetical protein